MKRRLIGLAMVLVMLLTLSGTAFAFPITIQKAGGNCSISKSGKSVTYGGYSDSGQTEDVISITVQLLEQSNGTWASIASTTNSKNNATYVSASSSKTVSGDHYYKAKATHYSMKDGVSYSTSSETSPVWIGA